MMWMGLYASMVDLLVVSYNSRYVEGCMLMLLWLLLWQVFVYGWIVTNGDDS